MAQTTTAQVRAGAPRRSYADRTFRLLTQVSALLILLLSVLLLYELFQQASPAIAAHGLRSLFAVRWSPSREAYGILSFVYGTVVTSLIAVLLGGGVGIGSAVFLAELAPRPLRAAVGYLIELLAAIPSVVYGFWGLAVLAPWLGRHAEPWLKAHFGFLPLFQGPTPGVGMLAAGLVLAVMILPTVASVSRDVLNAVPVAQREGMLALGATRWETIWKVLLPYARTGIIGAVILGLGRAMGETIAATMLIGNSAQIKASLFQPAYTMAAVIANQFNESTGLMRSSLIEVGLLLFLLTLAVNASAQALIWAMNRRVNG